MTKLKQINPFIPLLTIVAILSCMLAYNAWQKSNTTTQEVQRQQVKVTQSTEHVESIKAGPTRLLPDTTNEEQTFTHFMETALSASTDKGLRSNDQGFSKYGTADAQQALALLFSGEGGAPKSIVVSQNKMSFSRDYKGSYGLGTLSLKADYGNHNGKDIVDEQSYTVFVEFEKNAKSPYGLKLTHIALGRVGGD